MLSVFAKTFFSATRTNEYQTWTPVQHGGPSHQLPRPKTRAEIADMKR